MHKVSWFLIECITFIQNECLKSDIMLRHPEFWHDYLTATQLWRRDSMHNVAYLRAIYPGIHWIRNWTLTFDDAMMTNRANHTRLLIWFLIRDCQLSTFTTIESILFGHQSTNSKMMPLSFTVTSRHDEGLSIAAQCELKLHRISRSTAVTHTIVARSACSLQVSPIRLQVDLRLTASRLRLTTSASICQTFLRCSLNLTPMVAM
jgi:hypothetical protein